MSDKHTRSGGKFSGNHTTLTPVACQVADIADRCSAVYRISPGFLKAGLRAASGQRRVKLTDVGNDCILLAVRGSTTQQEIHVFTRNRQAAKLAIAIGARSAGLRIAFH